MLPFSCFSLSPLLEPVIRYKATGSSVCACVDLKLENLLFTGEGEREITRNEQNVVGGVYGAGVGEGSQGRAVQQHRTGDTELFFSASPTGVCKRGMKPSDQRHRRAG